MYVKGQGVPPDPAVAWTWFKRAAENPHADHATHDDAIYNGNLITKRIDQTDEAIKKQAVDEVSSELAQCSAFFTVLSNCIAHPGEFVGQLNLGYLKQAGKLHALRPSLRRGLHR